MKKPLALSVCVLCLTFAASVAVPATTRIVPSGSYLTIQSAVDASAPGDTVSISAGTYAEQVTVATSNLTITGAGAGVTVIQPLTVTANSTSLSTGNPIAAIMLVDGATGVTIEQLTVDGSLAGPNIGGCSPAFMGIFYHAASGVISDTSVTNIVDPSNLGCQGAIGIFVQSGNGGPNLNSNLVVDGNTVTNYGKNGITGNGAGTFITVTNNFVVGRGQLADPNAAQNGVQIGFGGHGKVTNNEISANGFTPNAWIGCGVLSFKAGGAIGQTRSNTFANNEQNVCNTAGGPSQFSPFN
jgi:hypothetical protein